MCLYPVTINLTGCDSTGIPHNGEPVQVPCGKCFECLQQRSIEWSHRIVDECKSHAQNCFLTLTYNNEHLPVDGSLNRRDVQLFLKRLRKKLQPQKIRVFYCGEYGKKALRPHYHIIVFGWFPSDCVFMPNHHTGDTLFRSPTVEKLWTFGFSSVGKVTLESAKYCAKYMQKLQKVPSNLIQPFTGMSNRPGIGFNAIDPKSLVGDRIYHGGKSCKVPRYYLKVLQRQGRDLTIFKYRRFVVGQKKAQLTDLKQRREKARLFCKKPLTRK